MNIKLIIIIFAFSILSFSQENIESRDSTTKQISLPRFDIHLGAGWVSGARIGIRFQPIENFSFETSFGIPVTFWGGIEREERYGIGINWHQSSTSGMILSLIVANIVRPDRTYSSIPNNRFLSYLRFSPNIGFFYLNKSNFTFFIRGGASYDFVEDNINFYRSKFGGPNLDIGIGWCFDFNK